MNLPEILTSAFKHEASDVHLVSDHPPMMRVNTVMTPMDYPVLTAKSISDALKEMISAEQMKTYEAHWDVDYSYEIPDFCRYRVNAHRQRDTVLPPCIPKPCKPSSYRR